MKREWMFRSLVLTAAIAGTSLQGWAATRMEANPVASTVQGKHKAHATKPAPKAPAAKAAQTKPATPKPAPANPPATKPASQAPSRPASRPVEASKPAQPKTLAINEALEGTQALTDLAGKAHAISEYKGKILVLNYWSADEAGGADYARRLNALSDTYGKQGVTVLNVVPGVWNADAAKGVTENVKKQGSTLPTMVDVGSKLAERLGAHASGSTFVFDKDGKLRYSGAIDDDPKGDKGNSATPYLAHALDALIAGKPINAPTTAAHGTPLRPLAPPASTPAHGDGAKGGR